MQKFSLLICANDVKTKNVFKECYCPHLGMHQSISLMILILISRLSTSQDITDISSFFITVIGIILIRSTMRLGITVALFLISSSTSGDRYLVLADNLR